MRALMYVEPLIEWGMPNLRHWWVMSSIALMQALEPDRSAWPNRFRLLTNDHLAAKAQAGLVVELLVVELPEFGTAPVRLPTDMLRVIDRDTLRTPFDADARTTSARWYDGAYTEAELETMANAVRSSLDGFEPEVIFTFSPAPFLARAFPGALVLHKEVGMFAQAPFPCNLYLDPCGVMRHSFPRRFVATLLDRPLTEAASAGIAKLRRFFLDEILIPKSPFASLKSDIRSRFDSVWIVPTHSEHAYSFDSKLRYRAFFDHLVRILDRVDSKIGIIVTEHPRASPIMTDELVEYFQQHYPNFIHIPSAWNVSCSTHFLFDIADGIIAANTGAALLALLWRKKVCAIGDSHLTAIADTQSVDDLDAVARQPWDERKDALLHWLLTHYYIPADRLYDGTFLVPWLTEALHRFREQGVGPDFFRPLDDAERLFDRIIATADTDVPKYRSDTLENLSFERLVHRCRAAEARADEADLLRRELAEMRAGDMRQFLLRPGSPMRLPPLDGSLDDAALRPRDAEGAALYERLAATGGAADACFAYGRHLALAGDRVLGAKFLLWAVLQGLPVDLRREVRRLLCEDVALFEAYFMVSSVVSRERTKREQTYLDPSMAPTLLIDRTVNDLRRDGFAVWPGLMAGQPFLSRAQALVDDLVVAHQDAFAGAPAGTLRLPGPVSGSEFRGGSVNYNGRRRIYFDYEGRSTGIEEIDSVMTNPLFLEVAARYYRSNVRSLYTLAEGLEPGEADQQWHVDAIRDQFKVMVLLNDVTPESGPIGIVPGSHMMEDLLTDTFHAWLKGGEPETYATQAVMERYGDRAFSGVGKPGDVVFFDTLTVHRGTVVRNGMRRNLVVAIHPDTLRNRAINPVTEESFRIP
ncbi:phytanoyl-CoA dioxygenase family protein [Azospirillum soli]|uniref:phytanoyl-CoA dioxygenase family protein n=1 Tax=Azospirillum soli TaxID=1304799 RepID=UPI001AE71A2A|nr:phytanoyl-CoA dioxygenase family protein [Azospirillum soli]MBP2316258.1 hypothetical protein [Azospirillum soli]